MTAAGEYRYCHPCGGEFWSTVTTCPDCGTLTVSYPPRLLRRLLATEAH